ncbi:MAG TPA: SusC/RagA family TonB-linked outer membrane protein [Gemmatimonadaceae bacterium]|nr:SusC/RagA family TonB-linked outer membrane protein [Gemmatimonadaceae bacterium]
MSSGLRRFLVGAFALAFAAPAGAQGVGTVVGRVTDQGTQAPVEGVQVLVVGSQRGTQTDAQGRYSIGGVPVGAHDIRARRVGYTSRVQTVTVQSGQSVTADFTLTQAVTQLQEVVVNAVTGQAQRRAEGGTNTGYIDTTMLNQGAITKMSDVLQGRVAGVNLQSASGAAGSSQRIRIRGANSLSLSNEPLLYVDGVQFSNNKGGFTLGGQDYSRLNDINPEDIENIEVLKGPAAAALYGSNAANGVILVTTKKGRSGQTRFGGYAEAGTSKDVNNYPLNYAALTTIDASKPYYEPQGGYLNVPAAIGAGAPYDICPNYRAAIPTGQTVNGQTSCNQDVLLSFDQFRDPRTTPFQTGTRAKFGANVSGGNSGQTFYVAADKQREDGVLRPNNFDQTSARGNFNTRLGSQANASISTSYVTNSTNRISSDNSIFSPLINGLLGPAQYIPGMESDTVGSAGNRYGSYFGYNTFDQRKVQADQSVDRFVIGANLNYTPLSWLRLNGNAGLDYFSRYDQQSINPNELPLSQSYILGFHQGQRSNSHNWTSNASATGTYALTSDLQTTTTVGGAFQRQLFESAYCYGVGIPSGTRSCSATTSQFAVAESYTDDRTVSSFAREELAYADKLFLSGSVRADNNSGLVSGLAYFPQANVSYMISKESWFPQVADVSELRLRAGIGQAGLRPTYGAAQTFYGASAVQSNNTETPALILSNTGNSELKLERTTETEAGFDIGFLGDRITGQYTAFRRRSKDALISVPLPPSAGLTGSVYRNLGSVSNRGQEFGLNATILDRSNVRFEGRLTATTLHNNIDALGAGVAPIVFNRGAQAHREGYPTGAFFALPIKYNDADGNGKLTRAEVTVDSSKIIPSLGLAYVGPSLPTNTQGIGGDLTLFKQFTISTLFERRGGNRQLNYTEYFRCRTQNANPFYGECSALANPNASLASQAAFIGAQYMSATPYGYIEDASFVKWRELTVRYDVPQSIGNRYRALNGLSFSVSGRNLHTWTKYTGLDPEINETGGGSNFTQGEFNTQPPVRTITFRVDIKP